MKDLFTKLRPAEIHIILDGDNAAFKDLLKFTFMDLLVRKVLAINEQSKAAHKNDPPRKMKYIVRGANYSNYKGETFELVFLNSFKKSKSRKIMFHHLIKIAYEEGDYRGNYAKNMLITSSRVREYFKQGIWSNLFSTPNLTQIGREAKVQLEAERKMLRDEFPQIMQSNKKEARIISFALMGNMFLIPDLDLGKVKELNADFVKASESRKSKQDGSFDYYAGCSGCWTSYDTHDRAFDSSYNSVDGSGAGSGCGGDGGCSGCGGCGGCGG